jgi:hypothetical protein
MMDDSFSNSSLYLTNQDGYVEYVDTTKAAYATVHNAATGTNLDLGASPDNLYNTYVGGGTKSYKIARVSRYFDTSSIPTGSTITSANLSLELSRPTTWNVDSDSLNITSGQPTYPRLPITLADYDYSLYPNTDGGSLLFSLVGSSSSVFNVSLTSTGLSFINISGTGAITRFFIRTKNDIASTAPTGVNALYVYTQAILYVYYTPPAAGGEVSAAFSCTPLAGVRNYTVTCMDSSNCTSCSSYTWYVTGSNPCISTNISTQNPTIFPKNFGWCSLGLEVVNASGSDTEVKSNYLYVAQPQVGF